MNRKKSSPHAFKRDQAPTSSTSLSRKKFSTKLSVWQTNLSKSNWTVVMLLLLAVVTRFYFLDNKPVHHDEAVNGWFVTQIQEKGYFAYSPENYHGPFLFYLFYVLERSFGRSLWIMRAATSFFGLMSIGLFIWWAKPRHKFWPHIALVWCLSPAFVFFTRSAIHESVFVFFQILFLIGCMEYLNEFKQKYLFMWIAGLIGMAINKETFAITVFCSFLAFAAVIWKCRDKLYQQKRIIAVGLLFGSGILFLFFTSFGKFAEGSLGFFQAFLPWFKTGMRGTIYKREFSYWIELILKNELPVFCGMIAAVWGIFKDAPMRQVSLLALMNFLIYSLLPYKTPWCLISIQWPFYFCLIMALSRLNLGVAAALVTASGLVAVPALYSINYKEPIDLSHPYVYVQSTYALKSIQRLIEPRLDDRIIVITDEVWPFPWILSKHRNWSHSRENLQEETFDVLILDERVWLANREQFKQKYWYSTATIREAREPIVLLLNQNTYPSPRGLPFKKWPEK